jgi:hypothetical protein
LVLGAGPSLCSRPSGCPAGASQPANATQDALDVDAERPRQRRCVTLGGEPPFLLGVISGSPLRILKRQHDGVRRARGDLRRRLLPFPKKKSAP